MAKFFIIITVFAFCLVKLSESTACPANKWSKWTTCPNPGAPLAQAVATLKSELTSSGCLVPQDFFSSSVESAMMNARATLMDYKKKNNIVTSKVRMPIPIKNDKPKGKGKSEKRRKRSIIQEETENNINDPAEIRLKRQVVVTVTTTKPTAAPTTMGTTLGIKVTATVPVATATTVKRVDGNVTVAPTLATVNPGNATTKTVVGNVTVAPTTAKPPPPPPVANGTVAPPPAGNATTTKPVVGNVTAAPTTAKPPPPPPAGNATTTKPVVGNATAAPTTAKPPPPPPLANGTTAPPPAGTTVKPPTPGPGTLPPTTKGGPVVALPPSTPVKLRRRILNLQEMCEDKTINLDSEIDPGFQALVNRIADTLWFMYDSKAPNPAPKNLVDLVKMVNPSLAVAMKKLSTLPAAQMASLKTMGAHLKTSMIGLLDLYFQTAVDVMTNRNFTNDVLLNISNQFMKFSNDAAYDWYQMMSAGGISLDKMPGLYTPFISGNVPNTPLFWGTGDPCYILLATCNLVDNDMLEEALDFSSSEMETLPVDKNSGLRPVDYSDTPFPDQAVAGCGFCFRKIQCCSAKKYTNFLEQDIQGDVCDDHTAACEVPPMADNTCDYVKTLPKTNYDQVIDKASPNNKETVKAQVSQLKDRLASLIDTDTPSMNCTKIDKLCYCCCGGYEPVLDKEGFVQCRLYLPPPPPPSTTKGPMTTAKPTNGSATAAPTTAKPPPPPPPATAAPTTAKPANVTTPTNVTTAKPANVTATAAPTTAKPPPPPPPPPPPANVTTATTAKPANATVATAAPTTAKPANVTTATNVTTAKPANVTAVPVANTVTVPTVASATTKGSNVTAAPTTVKVTNATVKVVGGNTVTVPTAAPITMAPAATTKGSNVTPAPTTVKVTNATVKVVGGNTVTVPTAAPITMAPAATTKGTTAKAGGKLITEDLDIADLDVSPGGCSGTFKYPTDCSDDDDCLYRLSWKTLPSPKGLHFDISSKITERGSWTGVLLGTTSRSPQSILAVYLEDGEWKTLDGYLDKNFQIRDRHNEIADATVSLSNSVLNLQFTKSCDSFVEKFDQDYCRSSIFYFAPVKSGSGANLNNIDFSTQTVPVGPLNTKVCF